MTYHGGCEVTKSAKWIANVWIHLIGHVGTPQAFEGWLAGVNPHKELEMKLETKETNNKDEL